MSVKKTAKNLSKALAKKRYARDRVNSCRKRFKRKEREVRKDLDQARKIWIELGEKFKWWQTLP